MPFQWRIVGGKDAGGILVREGQDLKSKQLPCRLSTGALVNQVALHGDRLHYQLVEGKGPPQGWVSLKISGRSLVEFERWVEDQDDEEQFDKWAVLGTKLGKDDDKLPSESELRARSVERVLEAVGRPFAVLGLEPGAGSKSVRRAYHILALLHHPDKGGDEVVFKAVGDAYRAVTQSRDELGGWHDLDGISLAPWQAHAPQGTKGVSVVLFDVFGTPPWESRRLYTACWQEGCVRCWELSPLLPNRSPRLAGEIAVGGFINDVAALSPFGLLTAQSAGMKPQPGESLRTWNLKQTPFRPTKRAQVNALLDQSLPVGHLDDQNRRAAPKSGSAVQPVVRAENGNDLVRGKHEDSEAFTAVDEFGYLHQSKMVFLHYRGVRSISLWPRVGKREITPHLVGTVSKDVIALSKIELDGCSLGPSVWKQTDPHGMTDVNVLRHESANRMWSGDNKGFMKCWDVNASGRGDIVSMSSGATGWLSGMELWDSAGMMCCSHSNGMCFVDVKAGKIVQDMKKKEAVGAITALGGENSTLFAGVGGDLMQYDTRKFGSDLDFKNMVVGMWSLGSAITALSLTQTAKGHTLVAVGCMNGKVAIIDST